MYCGHQSSILDYFWCIMWEIDRTFLCNLYFFVPTFSRIELYDMFLLSIKRTEPIHAILAAQYIVHVRLSLATLPSSAARCHCAYSLRPFPWRRSPVWSVEKRAGQCARNDVMWWIEAAVARVPRALTAAPLRVPQRTLCALLWVSCGFYFLPIVIK